MGCTDLIILQHVYECLKLTDEFRQLSDHHANHEDKLQVSTTTPWMQWNLKMWTPLGDVLIREVHWDNVHYVVLISRVSTFRGSTVEL